MDWSFNAPTEVFSYTSQTQPNSGNRSKSKSFVCACYIQGPNHTPEFHASFSRFTKNTIGSKYLRSTTEIFRVAQPINILIIHVGSSRESFKFHGADHILSLVSVPGSDRIPIKTLATQLETIIWRQLYLWLHPDFNWRATSFTVLHWRRFRARATSGHRMMDYFQRVQQSFHNLSPYLIINIREPPQHVQISRGRRD